MRKGVELENAIFDGIEGLEYLYNKIKSEQTITTIVSAHRLQSISDCHQFLLNILRGDPKTAVTIPSKVKDGVHTVIGTEYKLE